MATMESFTQQIERPWTAVEVEGHDVSRMETARDMRLWRVNVAIWVPFTLAVVEMFHPHPHDLLTVDERRWLMVHYAQLALFPLAALSQMLLIRGRTEYAAVLCRWAMFVFGVSYVAFDTAAGLVTGVLVRAAHATTAPEQWRGPLLAIWTHAVIGGSSDGAPVLAVLGTCAWLIGSLAAAFAIRRSGFSWWPSVFLTVSALGLLVFRTHAWPGGPVTFGALAVAALFIKREARRRPPASR
jgi:hypothetical protein